MFFEIRESFGWRVFVPNVGDPRSRIIHEYMTKASMWGGPDKLETLRGVECLGYEFQTMPKALDAIKEAWDHCLIEANF